MRVILLPTVAAAALSVGIPAFAADGHHGIATVLLAQNEAGTGDSGGAEKLPRKKSGGGGEKAGAGGTGAGEGNESTAGSGSSDQGAASGGGSSDQGTSAGSGSSDQGTTAGGASGDTNQAGTAGGSGGNNKAGTGGGTDSGESAGGDTGGSSGDNKKKEAGQSGGGSTNINITSEQRTEVTRAFSKVNVESVDIDVDLNVGVVVPKRVRTLHTCPNEVIRILHGLPSCRFIVVRNRIVIVNPSTRRVVTIIERSG